MGKENHPDLWGLMGFWLSLTLIPEESQYHHRGSREVTNGMWVWVCLSVAPVGLWSPLVIISLPCNCIVGVGVSATAELPHWLCGVRAINCEGPGGSRTPIKIAKQNNTAPRGNHKDRCPQGRLFESAGNMILLGSTFHSSTWPPQNHHHRSWGMTMVSCQLNRMATPIVFVISPVKLRRFLAPGMDL